MNCVIFDETSQYVLLVANGRGQEAYTHFISISWFGNLHGREYNTFTKEIRFS